MAPDCGSWWLAHVGHTYRYVLGAHGREPLLKRDAAYRLRAGASEWGILLGLPAAETLMADHVRDVARLADAAFLGDETGQVGALEALEANAVAQAELYRVAIPSFDAATFQELLGGHLAGTGGYIAALAASDYLLFREKLNDTLANRDRLVVFFRGVCMPQGRRSNPRGLPAGRFP